MRPVCVRCGREMQCIKNGVIVYHPYERPEPGPIAEDVRIIGRHVSFFRCINIDRLIDIDITKIDFIVHGDKYRCPDCGYEVVTGFGSILIDGQWSQDALKKTISRPGQEVVEIRRR